MHELVVGGAEDRVAGAVAEAARSISDCGCSMRTPIEKGLASMETPRAWSICERVARAVADREHDVIGRHVLAVGEHHATHAPSPSAIDVEIVDPLSKRYSPPSASIVGAHALDHRHQPERADVRLGDVEDFFRRAGLDEFGQHLAAVVAAGP